MRRHVSHEMIEAARVSLFAFRAVMRPDFLLERLQRYSAHLLEDVERGNLKRFVLNFGPRHGKTTIVSEDFCAWALGRNPHWRFVLAGYAQSIIVKSSREVQAMLADEVYQRIFPDVRLNPKIQQSKEWETTLGGGVRAVSIGSPLTGAGADCLIIDDPHKDRKEANSPTARKKVWEWWTGTAEKRLQPDGKVVVIHCIPGDEPVLMADGGWKPIKAIKVGDVVATKDGARKVLDQRQSGVDDVLEVKTQAKVTHCNGDHPFLVGDHWVKAKDLVKGDCLTTFHQGIGTREDVCERRARLFGFLIGDGWVTTWERKAKGKNGKISYSRSWCVCFARKVDEGKNQRQCDDFEHFYGVRPKYKPKCGYYRMDCNSLGRELLDVLPLDAGAKNKYLPEWLFAQTPAIKRAFLRGYASADGSRMKKCDDSYRIASASERLIGDVRRLAISAGVRHASISVCRQRVKPPHALKAIDSVIYSIAVNFSGGVRKRETLTSVTPTGRREPVYDLTVEGSESFVVGGLVVHNTRWHINDFTGRLMSPAVQKELADFPEARFKRVNIPAICKDPEKDPLGRKKGEPLMSMWPTNFLLAKKAQDKFEYAAQYDGNPPNLGGTHLDITRMNIIQASEVPPNLRYVWAIDTATTENTASDHTVMALIGFEIFRMSGVPLARVYVTKLIRGKWEWPKAKLKMIVAITRDRYPVYIEGVAGFRAVGQDLRAKLRNIAQVNIVTPEADKLTRALQWSTCLSNGHFHIVEDDWNDEFMLELEQFSGDPKDEDDQVDAISIGWKAAGPMSRGLVMA